MQKGIATAFLVFITTSCLFAVDGTNKISVSVVGEVHSPGFYTVSEGASMIDAVIASGGFTRKAKMWEVLIVSRHGKITKESFRKIKREVEEIQGSLSWPQTLDEYRKLSKILSDGDTIIVAEPSE